MRRGELRRGDVLAAPGSVKPRDAFTAEFYALSAEEGGRKTPFGVGYSPQLFFGTTDVTGQVTAVHGDDVARPGDRRSLEFRLLRPVAVEVGMRFALREGGRTVGAGLVTDVV